MGKGDLHGDVLKVKSAVLASNGVWQLKEKGHCRKITLMFPVWYRPDEKSISHHDGKYGLGDRHRDTYEGMNVVSLGQVCLGYMCILKCRQ